MERMNRRTAIQRGMHKFFTGLPCRNGHVNLRYTNTGACLSCIAVHNRNRARDTNSYSLRFNLRNPKDYRKVVAYIDALNLQFEIDHKMTPGDLKQQVADRIRGLALPGHESPDITPYGFPPPPTGNT